MVSLDMATSLPVPPGFDRLTVDEQIDYIQSLWDRIAAHADQLPLADWQRVTLEQRLAAHRNASQDAHPWRDVIDQLQRQLRSAR